MNDRRNWRKQRHTATRVYVRLRDEEGYTGSYATVQRYVKRRREEMARERDRRDAEGFLTVYMPPGEVQVDFGEAESSGSAAWSPGASTDGDLPALQRRAHPGLLGRRRPSASARGLRDVFEFVGGVPEEGGLRQRHRGRRARRRGGQDIGALPPLRGPLRDSTTPSPIPTRATRRATSRTRSAATGGTSSSPSRRSTMSHVHPQAA